MPVMNVSILLTLFIFAIVTHAWSDPDKSMNAAANRVTTMKMDENKGVVQKKKKPAQNPGRSIKKGNSKSQPALRCPDDGTDIASTKRDVDFLKAVEAKRRARWIDLDHISYSPEFLRGTRNHDIFTSREAPKSSDTDFSQSFTKPFPVGNKYFEGGTKLETLRHLDSKKEEILRQIFMGLRFSFTPTSRHVVLEMNVIPSYERGPGLVIPF
jgi:hypothetical protein